MAPLAASYQMVGGKVTDELDRMWKEAAIA
jgi:hypothetical protein